MILRALTFADMAGWSDDAHEDAFAAFVAGARHIAEKPPKTRDLGIDGTALRRAAGMALKQDDGSREAARAFFERHFVPHRIEADGFVTGYYEPDIAASLTRTDEFTMPLYRRPDDLVEVSEANRPADWDSSIRFARRTEDGLSLYFDRAAIEEGALAGRGLELAWLADPVDAFFIHVQGSARLRLHDGGTMRIGFDGKSGHAYTSIGQLAVERNILAKEDAHKDGLSDWLRRHPQEARALMRENRSFIFFRETEAGEGEGPVGAAGVSLSPGRSLAVDRTLHTFHTPVWVEAPTLALLDPRGRPFRRLMISQDTGSAIMGPARGDIFIGSGDAAGSVAGRIRHAASMIALVPRNGALGQ